MRYFNSRRRRLRTSMPSGVNRRRQPGRRRPRGNGNRRDLSAACETAKGTKRRDITPLPVRFWTVTEFPNYVIVCRPETVPLQVVAVLHGKRDLKDVLRQ